MPVDDAYMRNPPNYMPKRLQYLTQRGELDLVLARAAVTQWSLFRAKTVKKGKF